MATLMRGGYALVYIFQQLCCRIVQSSKGTQVFLHIFNMAESSRQDREIPIRLLKSSVLDSEFSNMRDRFDSEMKRMDDEMKKFRLEFLNRESYYSKAGSFTQFRFCENGNYDEEDILKTSPLIQNEGNHKVLRLRFDLSEYSPEDMMVKTIDNKLQIQARHEQKTGHKLICREFSKEFLLPQGTNPETIRSTLSRDGVLTVEAPLAAIE